MKCRKRSGASRLHRLPLDTNVSAGPAICPTHQKIDCAGLVVTVATSGFTAIARGCMKVPCHGRTLLGIVLIVAINDTQRIDCNIQAL